MPQTTQIKSKSARAQAMQGASVLAVAVALQAGVVAEARAQQTAQAPKVEEIVVTGSRVATQNLVSQTPVTTLGIDQMQDAAPVSLAVGLMEMPQFANSAGSATRNVQASATEAATTLNL